MRFFTLALYSDPRAIIMLAGHIIVLADGRIVMNYAAAMKELEACGTAQNRKVYVRHGATAGKVFGVSFANLKKIAKGIKQDHQLAQQLWRSNNYDARNLAAKVCVATTMAEAELEEWVADVDNYLHAGSMGSIASQSPDAWILLDKWTGSPQEFVKESGFSLLSSLAKDRHNELEDSQAKNFIRQIEQEIHQSSNWARYGMNWALIAVGTYKPKLTQLAIDAATRIGKVQVDHGETSCKTPDAVPYIKRAAAHYLKKRK